MTPQSHEILGGSAAPSLVTPAPTSPSANHSRHFCKGPLVPRVQVCRCSHCARRVEFIILVNLTDGVQQISSDDASSHGMVRFGHNLFYCDCCAKLVGFK